MVKQYHELFLEPADGYGIITKTNMDQLVRSPCKNWGFFLMKCSYDPEVYFEVYN